MENTLAVIDKNRNILFQGDRENCYFYMRSNKGWDDLCYLKDDGSLGKYSSWIL